jgi:transcriptional regulator with XRE-family HTH domain
LRRCGSARRGTQFESPESKEHPVTSLDTAIDQQALLVGRRIRELRRARGLTLVQLAAAAALSHPFLSQLERGLARPSMVSLERIARALGSSQVELLAAIDGAADVSAQPGVVVVRAHEGAQGPYGQAFGRVLTEGDRSFHPMLLVGTSADPGDYFTHAEDEFLHVIEGTVSIDLDEGSPRILRAGDSIYFVGGTPHRWWAIDEAGYRIFVVKERPAPSLNDAPSRRESQ